MSMPTIKYPEPIAGMMRKIDTLQHERELIIPYLRDMQERGDDEAKFLLNMLGDNS